MLGCLRERVGKTSWLSEKSSKRKEVSSSLLEGLRYGHYEYSCSGFIGFPLLTLLVLIIVYWTLIALKLALHLLCFVLSLVSLIFLL